MPKLNNKATVDSKIFARSYIKNGLNATKAAKELKPYLVDQSAKTAGHKMLKRPEVQTEIQVLMAAQGITRGYLVEKLNEGLMATDKEDHEDYNVRHKYLTTALKLHGELNDENKPTNQVNIGVVYIPKELQKGE